jgi:hypothetical protein
MLKKFASIAHSNEFGYVYDSQAFDVHAPIDCHFRAFKNYGDGLTAHSPDWSVQLDHLADYLASLAQAMLADEELAQNCLFTFSRRPSVKAIEFAASVKFKAGEEKDWLKGRRWFSAKELKVSKAPSKEHDKRYEEVREIHDGSVNSIFRILVGEYSSGLDKYLTADAIRDWVLAQDRGGLYMPMPAEFLKWTDDRDKARQLRDAVEACKNITESVRLRSATESLIENYRRSVAPRPEPEAAQAAPEPEAAHEETEATKPAA